MSTKAQKIKSETPRKFAVQHRNRCRLCGRPRGLLSQVRRLPDLLPEPGHPRADSGCQESKLVMP